MFGIHHLVGLAFCILSLMATGFTLAAAATLFFRPARARPGKSSRAPVTLLKPLHLAEPGLEENLRSFFRLDYDGPIQIVFGAQSRKDPALCVIEKLVREFPAANVKIVTDPAFGGSNPKVANLINMLAHARHEILVLSDSDIRVQPGYLHEILAALDEPEVGVVSCLYSGKPIGNVWATLAAMGIGYHFLPNVCLGMALRLTEPCFGSTIALKRRVLDEIGGFESLANVLADDYELGRAVREKGYRLSIPRAFAVEHVCSEQTFSQLFRQELRWARTNLLVAKSGYAGTLLTYPLPLAIIAVLLQGFSVLPLAVLGAAIASRACLAFQSDRFLGVRCGSLWLLPLRDVLSFAIFVASFFGHTVEWRGTRYVTADDGALAQLEGA
ncbi:MAG TPA: bacteriohopanetetrol glucosamine biosynthesis glycosyltransferase HpnI [Rhizomicrobium sp.]|jgi:ceramide glucosyltransferase